ncbi:hypothetical protein EO993_24855 [Escherichia coli]|nr:hypothetical protein [Escherichia coli]
MTDFGGKTSIFSHPVYLFLRKFSLQDSRGGSVSEQHQNKSVLPMTDSESVRGNMNMRMEADKNTVS